MAQKEKEVLVSSGGAGLGAAVAVESGSELGETEAVRARGYWELVWRRFPRGKVAIASGIFISSLTLAAFAGPPIASLSIGRGPDEIFTGSAGVELPSLLPADP